MDDKVGDSIHFEIEMEGMKCRFHIEPGKPLGRQLLGLLASTGGFEEIRETVRCLSATRHLWSLSDGQWKVSGLKSEALRIGLSLLIDYPNYKPRKQIILETDLDSGSVARILTGARGDCSAYFEDSNGEHRLTREGIHWLAKELVPVSEMPSSSSPDSGSP